jgi:ubiquinone/menaquinone biosynthesis C-methylase UbiE
VIVVDYADNSLAIIRKIIGPAKKGFYLVKADAFRLPFKDQCLDLVFHQGLLEHFREPVGLLAENHRVLKKGGLVLVDVPQKYHPYTLIKHALIMLNQWFAGWETEFTITRLKKMIEQQNFRVTKMYGNWMYPSLWYRLVREVLLKVHVARLPLYPRPWPLVGRLRQRVRAWGKTKTAALYTFNAIGIIGEKQ